MAVSFDFPFPSQKRLSPLSDTKLFFLMLRPPPRSTLTSYSTVNRPRCVALPEPVPFTTIVLGGSNWSTSTPVNVPFKGNCCCATAETLKMVMVQRTAKANNFDFVLSFFMFLSFQEVLRLNGAAGLVCFDSHQVMN